MHFGDRLYINLVHAQSTSLRFPATDVEVEVVHSVHVQSGARSHGRHEPVNGHPGRRGTVQRPASGAQLDPVGRDDRVDVSCLNVHVR